MFNVSTDTSTVQKTVIYNLSLMHYLFPSGKSTEITIDCAAIFPLVYDERPRATNGGQRVIINT